MAELFLSADEITHLTGCKFKRLQKLFLRREGFPFTENARGEPVVLKLEVIRRLSRAVQSESVPDYSELDGPNNG